MPKVRETCTACTARRQKCDKKIPCSRCVKRGVADACTRQWPAKNISGRDESAANPLESSIQSSQIYHGEEHSVLQLAETEPVGELSNNNEVSTLDFMTWRPTQKTFEKNVEPHRLDVHAVGSVAGLQLLLPNTSLMWKLINFHEKRLLWYHGCFHGPTFNSQVEERLKRQNAGQADVLRIDAHDLQWTALLFSVLASSATCASEYQLSEWAVSSEESSQLCTQWYTATITCLRLGNYTSDHNILSAQAIATLTMCAHTLGFSSDLHVHLGTAVRIAQSLNLHRIKSNGEMITSQSSADQRLAVLKIEIGRRLWSQLCIQDWFSIPLAEAHAIHRGHFTTKKPANRDHLSMESIPDSTPTYVSYGNYLYEIAALIADLHAKSINMNTDFTRYQLVMEYDTKMRRLATEGRPHYFDVTVPVEESWPWFIPWARRSLTICFAHKIMMIHRNFLKRSFTNLAFSFTRRTCIAASKTILNEAKLGRDERDPIIWIDSAFCIAAAITLALDVCHREESEPEFVTHRTLVNECISMLRTQVGSTLALRGVRLLQILLQKPSPLARSATNPARLPRNTQSSNQKDSNSAVTILSAIHSGNSDRQNQDGASLEMSMNNIPSDEADELMNDSQDTLDIDELFVELFPPQSGFSNAYLFEELMDMNLGR